MFISDHQGCRMGEIRICSHHGLWRQTQTGVSSTTRKGHIGLCCFSTLISLRLQENYSLCHPSGTLQRNQNRICIFRVQEVALFVLQPHRTSTTQTTQIIPFIPLFLSDLNTLTVLRKHAECPLSNLSSGWTAGPTWAIYLCTRAELSMAANYCSKAFEMANLHVKFFLGHKIGFWFLKFTFSSSAINFSSPPMVAISFCFSWKAVKASVVLLAAVWDGMAAVH